LKRIDYEEQAFFGLSGRIRIGISVQRVFEHPADYGGRFWQYGIWCSRRRNHREQK
jgi:hypothetical protein